MKIVRAAWDMVSFGGPRNLAASWPQREGLWTHLEATIAVYLVSSWNIDFSFSPYHNLLLCFRRRLRMHYSHRPKLSAKDHTYGRRCMDEVEARFARDPYDVSYAQVFDALDVYEAFVQSIRLAQGGSWDDLMIVTRRMTGQTVDAGVYTAAVKMFARRLVEQTKCLGQSPLALDTGMTCVLGLIAVFTATYTRTMGESKILNCIRSYSRYVADWVIRAGEIIILEGDPDHNMVLRLDGMYTIIRGGFSLVAELEEEGLKDDRIFDLLIRLWLRAGLKKDKKLIEVVSVALSIVDGPLLLSQGDNVLDIASRHNDSIMSVMQTAIDHFKRDMRWFQTLATTFSLPTVSVNFSTMHGHLLFLAILVSGVSWDGPRNRSGEIDIQQIFRRGRGPEGRSARRRRDYQARSTKRPRRYVSNGSPYGSSLEGILSREEQFAMGPDGSAYDAGHGCGSSQNHNQSVACLQDARGGSTSCRHEASHRHARIVDGYSFGREADEEALAHQEGRGERQARQGDARERTQTILVPFH